MIAPMLSRCLAVRRFALGVVLVAAPFFLAVLASAVRGEEPGPVRQDQSRSRATIGRLEVAVEADSAKATEGGFRVGVAVADITPPEGFPMAGYYHERLAEGTIDPLRAKAIVFRDGESEAALVVCDLIGIATDLSREVRRRASERTGIPSANIVIAATHSHTAPDYMKELWLYLGDEQQEPLRKAYIEKMITQPVAAIVKAHAEASATTLKYGSAQQETPVSFNRRFVMRDGSVRTWMNWENPDVVRAAGPIDPEIGLLAIYPLGGSPPDGAPSGTDSADVATRPKASPNTSETGPAAILSNFALHLDTVGGSRWSADYPYFIEQTLRQTLGSGLVSIFGTGCCGDINHVDPRRRERNKADYIGGSIGDSIQRQVAQLTAIENPRLSVKSDVVHLPLQDAAKEEVDRSIQLLQAARRGERIEFFDHVTAYKKMILDQLRHPEPHATTSEHITWGLSRSLAGIGETLPADVTVIAIGHEAAIVCLPGEVFVDLGLAIKQASPFKTTLVVELSNHVETIYIPHRGAYAGGSYEVTNSTLEPGSGEMLVESAVRLLREAAESLKE